MNRTSMGRAGAPRKTSKNHFNFTSLASRIKALIVTLALWGVIPIGVADWIIRQGRAHDD
ncbi:hypothetical protein [Nitrosococcus wardiae]|uniref:Uncharacterized protein n=1 Tax=Nitrosococcus wardiae TaxID=1814290 RepID=A0A4P7C157_9GAMM|nr:hypothetical protein [Nitrosococcus wardiae]QBQ56111.1 hypothetical protein E3U44_17540 [Nitrosococcus wardiae]